jgi:hypothetical protein
MQIHYLVNMQIGIILVFFHLTKKDVPKFFKNSKALNGVILCLDWDGMQHAK